MNHVVYTTRVVKDYIHLLGDVNRRLCEIFYDLTQSSIYWVIPDKTAPNRTLMMVSTDKQCADWLFV